MRYLLYCGLVLASLSCMPRTTPSGPVTENYTAQAATIRMFVATRGSYQYLLAIPRTGAEDLLCMPDYLPEALRQDGMAVTVSGKVLADSINIMKPSPTDAPEYAFSVPTFAVSSIEAR